MNPDAPRIQTERLLRPPLYENTLQYAILSREWPPQ